MGDMHSAGPRTSRPYMPGYGTKPAGEGTGLLPWAWAEERLVASHDYWLATTWPDGRPHVMPVWGLWHEGALWFTTGRGSRKARNLLERPRCVATTDRPSEPVVIEGDAQAVEDLEVYRAYIGLANAKYDVGMTEEEFPPERNVCFRIAPVWAFGLVEQDFTGSPTRWQFGEDSNG